MANTIRASVRNNSNMRIKQTGANNQRIAMRVPRNTRITVKGNSKVKVG